MTLMERRRALMTAQGGGLPPVPSGYITNGLVFFLDGKQLATSSKWTDIVGGKVFNLINCSIGSTGVIFDGTAWGECPGQITNDWENETIEVAFNGISGITGKTLFYQPYVDNTLGISMRFGLEGGYMARVCLSPDGVRKTFKTIHLAQSQNRLSGNGDLVVRNGAETTTVSSTTSYSKNLTGNTYLGCHKLSVDGNKGGFYIGTIMAVRIYNRKLMLAEIQANQATDLTYYNL